MNFDINKEIYIQELEKSLINITRENVMYKAAFAQLLNERELLFSEFAELKKEEQPLEDKKEE